MIGYTAGVLAKRAGPGGRVLAFEPNPLNFQTLQENVARWAGLPVAPVETHELALSDRAGRAILSVPDNFLQGAGGGSLGPFDHPVAATYQVALATLDSLVSGPIGVLKLDVQGHELTVLEGASQLLAERLIRDIVFEDHYAPPTPVMDRLVAGGYTLFRLEQRFSGPLADRDVQAQPRPFCGPPNFVATLDPDRCTRLLGAKGWACLRRR
jgi:FkbM family methyltransferase